MNVNDKLFQRPLNSDVPEDKLVLNMYVQFLVEDFLKTPVANCKWFKNKA